MKNVLKSKLKSAFGVAGDFIWLFIMGLLWAIPIWILNLPWYYNSLLIGILYFIPITEPVFWIWAFIKAVSDVQSPFTIIFYVVFAVRLLIFVIPLIALGIATKKDHDTQDETELIQEETELIQETDTTLNPIKAHTTKNYDFKTLGIIFLLVVLIIVSILSITQISSLKKEIQTKESTIETWKGVANSKNNKISGLEDINAEFKEKVDFFDENVVFCDDESNYYHKYECENWNRNSFYAYNTENAIYQGYKPCPECCN